MTTTQFDQIFEDMSAPEYPATCDECGEVGTNESMESHSCKGEQMTMACRYCNTLIRPFGSAWIHVGTGFDTCRDKEGIQRATPVDRAVVQPERAVGGHTPTPWRVTHDEVDGDEIVAENGLAIAIVYGTYKRLNPHNDSAICHANAQLIVTVANSHAQLVAALEQLISYAGGLETRLNKSEGAAVREANDALSRVRG